MSEMALTADQVVVIGKDELIAEMPIDEFTSRSSQCYVRDVHRNSTGWPALQAAGASVAARTTAHLGEGDGAENIGELTLHESIVLSELAPQSASLEEAFIGPLRPPRVPG